MFKVSTKNMKEDEGIVYLLEIELEDRLLVKIGVTARKKVEDRVVEILTGIWKKYRIFPRCYVKRYRKTSEIFNKETILHRYFKDYQYETKHIFGGSTEMFDISLDSAVEAYEKVLKGEQLEDKYIKPESTE
jgi:hypothetical protein